MTNLVTDIFRSMIWLLAKFLLQIMDKVFEIVKSILSLDIGTVSQMWDIWSIMVVFVVIIVSIKCAYMFFDAAFDEEKMSRFKASSIISNIIKIALVLAIAPFIIRGISAFSSAAVDNIGIFLDYDSDMTPSEIVLTASIDSAKLLGEDTGNDFELNEIHSINETDGDGNYLYLPSFTSLLMTLVIALGVGYLLVLIAIQGGMRFYGLGYKIIIGVYPIAMMVDPNDQSFSNWKKLVFADLISNFAQFLLLCFVLMIASTDIVRDLGPIAQALMLIAGFFVVLNAPAGLAQILGSDMGLQQTMQNMMMMKGMGQSFGHAVGAGATMVAAGGVYGMGRMLGGNSMLGGNRVSGGALNGISGRSGGASGSGTDGAGGSGSGVSAGYDSGSAGGSSDGGYSGGAGSYGSGGSSFGNGGGSLGTSASEYRDGFSGSNSFDGPDSAGGGSVGYGGSAGGTSNGWSINNRDDFVGAMRDAMGSGDAESLTPSARNNSVASKVANYGRNTQANTLKSVAARTATSMGGYMYQKSAQRLSRKTRTHSGYVRDNRVMQGSVVAHKTANAIKNNIFQSNGNAGKAEVPRYEASDPEKTV